MRRFAWRRSWNWAAISRRNTPEERRAARASRWCPGETRGGGDRVARRRRASLLRDSPRPHLVLRVRVVSHPRRARPGGRPAGRRVAARTPPRARSDAVVVGGHLVCLGGV